MLAYVLKRILLLLPTVWLLCSLTFFLSKMVPGTFTDRQNADNDERIIAVGSNNSDAQNVTNQVAKPLFYISLLAGTEPDTLYQVQPAAHQTFLKSLLLTNGNWPVIANFYQQLLRLQKSIQLLPAGAAEKQPLLYLIHNILTETKIAALPTALKALENRIIKQSWGVNKQYHLEAVHRSFAIMQARAQPWRNWLPVFTWRGTDNQYHYWLMQVVRGNLGTSYRNQLPVSTTIAEAFGNTFAITLISLSLIIILSVALSNWLSRSSFRKWRELVLTLLYTVESIPLFVTALLLLTIFASSAYLDILPAYGTGPDVEAGTPAYLVWLYRLPYLALPVLSLTIVNLPYVTGQIYQAVQQVQQRDYILTAKAKGLSEAKVWRRHVLRNALLPVITLFTGFLPALVSGAVVIEIIYAVPGMGRLLQDSVLARDFPVVIGLVLCLGLIKVTAHIIADVLYYLADPRIRLHT